MNLRGGGTVVLRVKIWDCPCCLPVAVGPATLRGGMQTELACKGIWNSNRNTNTSIRS